MIQKQKLKFLKNFKFVFIFLYHHIHFVSLQKTLQRQNNTYGGTTTVHNRKQISGTASSVAFTPLQVRFIFKFVFLFYIFFLGFGNC